MKGPDRQLEALSPADLRRAAPPNSIFTTSQPTITGDEVGEHAFGGGNGRMIAFASQISGRAAHARKVVGIDAAAGIAQSGTDAAAKILPSTVSATAETPSDDVRYLNPISSFEEEDNALGPDATE